jgi:hypothetical protein
MADNGEKRLLISFDGVVAVGLGGEDVRDRESFRKGKARPAPGIFGRLHGFLDLGYEVVIGSWRFREGETKNSARAWLQDWEMSWRRAMVAGRKDVPDKLLFARPLSLEAMPGPFSAILDDKAI